MCGIAGILAFGYQFSELQAAASKMAAAITHRGPDDGGTWVDSTAGVAFAHRRLSILDLSPAGHQPMHSFCGRYVITFNGEIYNHLCLRKELIKTGACIKWRGRSDTETLLACISAWGIERALKASIGMFAFALWDREERILFLARDRMGEKPLYYGILNQKIVFASELKAIRALSEINLEIDRSVLGLLMRRSYVPEPHCIYKGFKKLQPGTWLEVKPGALKKEIMQKSCTYWSAIDAVQTSKKKKFEFGTDHEAIQSLDKQLRESVRLQMMADVPFGAFLSGGIDSSTVVALMQAQSDRPIKTFSIGFDEKNYNEARHAKAVADHLGTDHRELYISSKDALAVIPRLSTIYDEPFSDVSQIPTYLVAQMARNHVAVSLSGDGGDEIFGGYARYFLAARLWHFLEKTPFPLRRISASIIKALPSERLDSICRGIDFFLPEKYKSKLSGERLHKGASAIESYNGVDLYQKLVSHWNPSELIPEYTEPCTPFQTGCPGLSNLVEQMMILDSVTYLPGDILTKIDRAAMAVSLETRVPLLDHQVYEFAWSLPLHYKVRNGEGKWLLKQVLYKYIPKHLVNRPKMGFGVPIDIWLRGPLRDWVESLISPTILKHDGNFYADRIFRIWKEHLSGQKNWQYLLWNVLIFQAWAKNSS